MCKGLERQEDKARSTVAHADSESRVAVLNRGEGFQLLDQNPVLK
jgi:hypothetical protein